MAEGRIKYAKYKSPKRKPDLKRKPRAKSPTTAEHDSEGRPVGVGGLRRRQTIDDIVDKAQRGKKK